MRQPPAFTFFQALKSQTNYLSWAGKIANCHHTQWLAPNVQLSFCLAISPKQSIFSECPEIWHLFYIQKKALEKKSLLAVQQTANTLTVCLVMSGVGEPPVYLLYQRERARWATSSGTLPEATSKGPLILFSSFLRESFVIVQKCRSQSSREDVKGALHWAHSIWYVYFGRANRSWIYNFAKCNYFFFF